MKCLIIVLLLLNNVEIFASSEINSNKTSDNSENPNVLPVFVSHQHTPNGEVVFFNSRFDDLIDKYFDISKLSNTIYLIDSKK